MKHLCCCVVSLSISSSINWIGSIHLNLNLQYVEEDRTLHCPLGINKIFLTLTEAPHQIWWYTDCWNSWKHIWCWLELCVCAATEASLVLASRWCSLDCRYESADDVALLLSACLHWHNVPLFHLVMLCLLNVLFPDPISSIQDLIKWSKLINVCTYHAILSLTFSKRNLETGHKNRYDCVDYKFVIDCYLTLLLPHLK